MTDWELMLLKDTMHSISAGMLVPTIAALLLFVACIVIELGSLLVEVLTDRRKSKGDVSLLLEAFQGKEAQEIETLINDSSLLKRHKTVLHELIRYKGLPSASREALARHLMNTEEQYFIKKNRLTDLVARLGPMLGLMATLIPLGPGLIAMSQGDTKTLADSLLTAFDATVTGLAAAGVAYGISQLRKRWYEGYLSTLEALMEGLLEVFGCENGVEG